MVEESARRASRLRTAALTVIVGLAGIAVAGPLATWLGSTSIESPGPGAAAGSGQLHATQMATATASPLPVATTTSAAAPSVEAETDASITLMVQGVYGFEGALQFATLTGGPTVVLGHELQEVETLPLAAGTYELSVYNRVCDGNCDYLGPAGYYCTTSLSLAADDSIFIRMHLRETPCLVEMSARPPVESDPDTIVGELDIGPIGNRKDSTACGFVLDRWGYYWNFTLPPEYRIGYLPDSAVAVFDPEGQMVARIVDRVRLHGTRRNAEQTHCVERVPWRSRLDAQGIAFAATDITVVIARDR